jgi:hypothetical protein
LRDRRIADIESGIYGNPKGRMRGYGSVLVAEQ